MVVIILKHPSVIILIKTFLNIYDFIKIFIILEQYILMLHIPALHERPPPSKEALKSYLATHLSLSTKYKRKEKLRFFVQYMEEATSQDILTKKDAYEILHIRKAGYEIFDTVLNNCVKNNDIESATEILKFEKEVHDENKLSLLQCARINLVDEELKQWIIRQIYNEPNNDCLGKKTKMWFSIIVGTFLFSMGTYAMDQERQILKYEIE